MGGCRLGLARHRALLFKTLADACELPCQLLRGCYHLGAILICGQCIPCQLGRSGATHVGWEWVGGVCIAIRWIGGLQEAVRMGGLHTGICFGGRDGPTMSRVCDTKKGPEAPPLLGKIVRIRRHVQAFSLCHTPWTQRTCKPAAMQRLLHAKG